MNGMPSTAPNMVGGPVEVISPSGFRRYLLYLFAAASQLMFLKNASMYRARSNW